MDDIDDLECFSEAESAPMRSACKFCVDLYVRNFSQLFQKIFFQSTKTIFFRKIWKKSKIFQILREKPQLFIKENLKEIHHLAHFRLEKSATSLQTEETTQDIFARRDRTKNPLLRFSILCMGSITSKYGRPNLSGG